MTGLSAELTTNVGAFQLRCELAVAGGQILAVVGPNGAGKTTLLLSLLGIVAPTRGRITVGDDLVFQRDEGARTATVDRATEDRRIGYVPQDYGLFPHLSARDNVDFALACLAPKPARPERRQRAQALLERLGATGFSDRRPAALSAGERQRVALARALATEPKVLLFDEPFAALDVTARADVRRTLRAHLGELGLPALVVTHDRADVEALGADTLVLEAGRVVQRGPLSALQAHPATPYVARFCGQNLEAT
jgi:molybdate transport system ATP-binding protein